MDEEKHAITEDRPAESPVPPSSGSGRSAAVLQVLPALGAQGGVERGAVEVAQAVSAAGGRAFIVSAGGPLVHELRRSGATHVKLPLDSKNPFVMRANAKALARLIEAEKINIVHARSRAPAWSAEAAARKTGAYFVTTFHGTYSAGNWLKRRYNAVMARGERVIAISKFIAGHVRRVYGVPASRIRIIHRGVDLNRFDAARVSAERVAKLAREWRLVDGVPVVMLPGRLTRWKGQTVLIEAIAKLGRRDLRCMIVGSDQGRSAYRRELVRLVGRLGLNEVVRFVDHCGDMPAAYMLTDVAVSASTDPEAFGRVVAEAQALGRPVIATDHGAAREIVIPEETGWLVPPGDVAALAERLGRVLYLPAEARHRLAAQAVANVRTNFTTELMCARTLAVYDEVLADHQDG